MSELKPGAPATTGDIRPTASLRAYYLDAKVDNSYNVTYTALKGGTTELVYVFRPIGDRLTLTGSGTTQKIDFIPRTTSRHLILVEEGGANETFDFRIIASCLGPTCVGDTSLRLSPASSRLTAVQGSREILQTVVQVTASPEASSFTVGTIRQPWLSVSPTGGALPALLRVLVDPRSLPLGTSKAVIPLQSDSGASAEFALDVDVRAGVEGSFEVESPDLNFSLTGDPQQDRPSARIFSVRSSSKADLKVTAATKNSSTWLAVSPGEATVSPGQVVEITVRLDPSALPGGILRDSIVVAANGSTKEVPISVNVTTGEPATPLLSTTAITLFAQIREVGNLRTVQNISDVRDMILMNLGPGNLDWAVSSDKPFVQTAPAFGDVLKAGEYQRISIATTSAIENLRAQDGQSRESSEMKFRLGEQSTRKVDVKVRLSTLVPPRITEAGIVLSSGQLDTRALEIRHSESDERQFQVRLPDWVEMNPSNNLKLTRNTPFAFTLRLKPGAKVTPGLTGDVTITFPGYFRVGNGRSEDHTLNISVIAADTLAGVNATRSAEECVPSKLFAVFVTPGNLFRWETGLPLNIEARIMTDCGTPLQFGAASVSFSSGEPAIALSAWPDGLWRGTWIPSQPSEDLVRVRLAAVADGTGAFTQSIVFGAVIPEQAAGQVIP